MTADDWKDYEILGSGSGEKLERWKDIYLLRPDPQAIWKPEFELSKFKGLHAHYKRSSSGGGYWKKLRPMPEMWNVEWHDLKFSVSPMGFKHTGLFPEQSVNWAQMRKLIKSAEREITVLNLFGYTGGASVACASAGAKVTHVDAAKGMVDRCKTNVALSGLGNDSVRYIVDDCTKFVRREIKRGKKYDAVIMDPPSYGRGTGGEVWKLEDNVFDFIELVKGVLSENPLFFLVNSYTTGLQPTVIDNMLSIALASYGGSHSAYEVGIKTSDGRGVVLPCGCSALWREST